MTNNLHPDNACTKVSASGAKVCHLYDGHPGLLHVDITGGGMTFWSETTDTWANVAAGPADPQQDAPAALRLDPVPVGQTYAVDQPEPSSPPSE